MLPTLVELVVGCGCERLFDIRLWDYSHYVVTVEGEEIPLHFMGYIALPISLIWLVLIFVAMGFFFPVLLKLMERIPPKSDQNSRYHPWRNYGSRYYRVLYRCTHIKREDI